MKGPLFYSKILLFGEYGIIRDSKGLSIPYNFYNGALKKDANPSAEAIQSNGHLKRFVVYLEQLHKEQPDLVTFDLDTLNNEKKLNAEAFGVDLKVGNFGDGSIIKGN